MSNKAFLIFTLTLRNTYPLNYTDSFPLFYAPILQLSIFNVFFCESLPWHCLACFTDLTSSIFTQWPNHFNYYSSNLLFIFFIIYSFISLIRHLFSYFLLRFWFNANNICLFHLIVLCFISCEWAEMKDLMKMGVMITFLQHFRQSFHFRQDIFLSTNSS